jgi:hypothetical protein
MKPIPIYGFDRLSDAELITKADHILLCMTGNSNYPDATPLVIKVKTARDEFSTSLVSAKDGGKPKTADKDKKRKVLAKALKDLALHVQLNCKDDVSILLTSGYDARKDGEPAEEPGAPENFKVESGANSGSVDVSVDSNENANIYVFEYAPVPETGEPSWNTLVGKKKRTIRDLVPGKKYMFRAALKGKSDDLVYSETISRFVA